MDQIGGVAAEERLSGELGLDLLHRPVGEQLLIRGVDDDAVVARLHIPDLADGHGAQPAYAAHLNAQGLILRDAGEGAIETEPEPRVAHRLDEKVERIHAVALHGVLHHGGDEQNDHPFVLSPDAPRRGQPVHAGHRHVQQQKVKALAIAAQQGFAVFKRRADELLAALLRIAVQVAQQRLPLKCHVLRNRNPNHMRPSVCDGFDNIIIPSSGGEGQAAVFISADRMADFSDQMAGREQNVLFGCRCVPVGRAALAAADRG